MSAPLIDRAGVAEALGMSLTWTYRHLGKLIADEGFPPAAFGRMSGARWDPVAIDQWLASRPGRAKAAAAPPAADPTLADQSAELDRRSAAMATSGRRAA